MQHQRCNTQISQVFYIADFLSTVDISLQDDIMLNNISTVTIHVGSIVTKSLSVSTKAVKNEWEWVRGRFNRRKENEGCVVM